MLLTKSLFARRPRRGEGTFFAWLPVKVSGGKTVWLKPVTRYRHTVRRLKR